MRKVTKKKEGSDYYKECDNHIIRSINQERYLQRVLKATLSPFHEKRCCIDKPKSKTWKDKIDFWMVCFIRIQLSAFVH